MPKSNPRVTIISNEWITEKIRLLKLKTHDADRISYIPGQFISFHFPDPDNGDKLLRRSYSIASLHPSTENITEIDIVLTILPDGLASNFFDAAKVGMEVEMSGPYGALVLAKELPKRIFLVATSTGVAPFRTMLPQIAEMLDAGTEIDIELILGVQTPTEALFAEDFRAFTKAHPRFQFNLCYSRAAAHELQADEYSGYVQYRLEALAPTPENDLVYLCGNPDMIDNAYKLLTERGFSPRQVKREKYISGRR